MRIERDSYVDRLARHRGNGMIKVVTGIRRCGKSYLMNTLLRERLVASGVGERRIVSLALDDEANAAYLDPSRLSEHLRSVISGDGSDWVVMLDEAQYAISAEELRDGSRPPRLYGVLNGLLRMRGVDVYVSGSNSRLLSSDVMTEFRGRGDEIRVHPLSFAEYHAAAGGEWDDDWGDYLTFGGMPLVASLDDERERSSYLSRLFAETYLRDIVERNGVQREDELSELVDVLASGVGSLTNPHKLQDTFRSEKRVELTDVTIKKFIGYMEDAFLLSHAKRYDVKGRRHINSTMKYYFEDVGLRNARLNFRQQELSHIMENVIYNELVARGYSVDVGVVDVTEAGQRKRLEVDFVANLGSRRYYVQSAFSMSDAAKRAQETRPLRAVGDEFRKVVVTGGSARPSRDESGVVTMGVKQFLLDPDSLEA